MNDKAQDAKKAPPKVPAKKSAPKSDKGDKAKTGKTVDMKALNALFNKYDAQEEAVDKAEAAVEAARVERSAIAKQIRELAGFTGPFRHKGVVVAVRHGGAENHYLKQVEAGKKDILNVA